jgi:tRNA nucleotidyltransferase/poly(A) polymerase
MRLALALNEYAQPGDSTTAGAIGNPVERFREDKLRLLRALRFAARMGFKLESRTQEWFNLAIERELHKTITPEDAGDELRGLAREERPHLVLKEWDEKDLLEYVHPLLAKKHPDYDAISRLFKVRDDLFMAGLRPRLATPTMLAILGRLKDRELGNVLSKLGFRAAEIDTIQEFPDTANDIQKELTGKKTKTPIEAFRYIEKLPLDVMAYLLAESNNSTAVSKLKAYLHKWRPIRQGLQAVVNELEAIGMERGPKFDQVVDAVFAAQLNGRGKTPEERVKMLRKLSGIKEAPKKKEKEKKGRPPEAKPKTAAERGAARAKIQAGMKASAGKKQAKK